MDNNNSLKSKEKSLKKASVPKHLRKVNTMKNLNNKKMKKLDLDLSSYYRLTKKNGKLQGNCSTMKKNNIWTIENKDKDSILYKKFLEFQKNSKSQSGIKNDVKDWNNTFFSVKSSISHNSSLTNSKNKANNKKNKIEIKQDKVNKNVKDMKKIQKRKTAKIINKTELFNSIINNNKKKEEIKRNNNYLRKTNSCQNFNNDKLQKKLGFKETKTVKKSKKKKKNNTTLNLISKKYFERIKFNKYKYYNKNNNDYANERRKRVEDKLNDIIYEKYKVSRPLRITERKFLLEEESKNDKNNNKINYDNNFKNLNINNNIIHDLNYFINLNDNIDDHNENNNNNNNNKNSSQIKYYNNRINNIIKMRKKLSLENFFGEFRRDYNLLDFNFTFLFHNQKINK